MEKLFFKENDALNVLGDSDRKLNTFLFFLILFLFQLIFTFQGVDVGDGGSYANFYQQIFKNPISVQYSFMFWLSGVIGGLYLKLFPALGLWGIRLAGVLISTSTIFFAYKLLKNYLNIGYLQLSLFILTLFINNNPKELYYNNLSAFIYVLVVYFLFLGLLRNKLSLICLSGAFVALNVFNRTPNILGTLIIIGILYAGSLYRTDYKIQVKQCLSFIFGLIISTVFVLLVIYLIGHLQLYTNSLKLVFSMGKASKQVDGLENNYGIINLIKLLYGQYKFAFFTAILFYAFVLFIIPLAQLIKVKFPSSLTDFIFSKYLLLSLVVILIMTRKIDYIIVIYFFTGISVITAAAILITSRNKEIKLLTFLGIFVAIIHPIGSSTGIHTVIIYSLWLVFPLVFEYLFTIKHVGLKLNFSGNYTDFSSALNISKTQLAEIKRTGLGVVIFACLYNSFYYPYFDRNNRLDMHYSINNKFMKGIFTSKERATALNELLEESDKYIKPDDYVLAYDCIPLYHYMTETKPYLRNSWPWLYQPDIFQNELTKAKTEIQPLPLVIFQIVRTNGPNGGKWPDYSSNETTLNWDQNKSRNEILMEFLKENHYREVWANKAFKILKPDESGLSLK